MTSGMHTVYSTWGFAKLVQGVILSFHGQRYRLSLTTPSIRLVIDVAYPVCVVQMRCCVSLSRSVLKCSSTNMNSFVKRYIDRFEKVRRRDAIYMFL